MNNECDKHRQFEASCVVCQLMHARDERHSLAARVSSLSSEVKELEQQAIEREKTNAQITTEFVRMEAKLAAAERALSELRPYACPGCNGMAIQCYNYKSCQVFKAYDATKEKEE